VLAGADTESLIAEFSQGKSMNDLQLIARLASLMVAALKAPLPDASQLAMFAAVLGDATDTDAEADADSDASTATAAQNSQHATNDAANEAHRDADDSASSSASRGNPGMSAASAHVHTHAHTPAHASLDGESRGSAIEACPLQQVWHGAT